MKRKETKNLIIMPSRLHEKDLTGYVFIKNPGYKFLRLSENSNIDCKSKIERKIK
jgi:hypothetical protein